MISTYLAYYILRIHSKLEVYYLVSTISHSYVTVFNSYYRVSNCMYWNAMVCWNLALEIDSISMNTCILKSLYPPLISIQYWGRMRFLEHNCISLCNREKLYFILQNKRYIDLIAFELEVWSKEILFRFRKLQTTAKIGNVFILWIHVFFATKFQSCIPNTVLYVLMQFIPGNLFLVRVINLQQCTSTILAW